MSAQASVTPQGRSSASSRANEGLESTAILAGGGVSASSSGMSARLPRSMPFEQLTIGVPSFSSERSSLLTARTCCAGGASSRKSTLATAKARSFVAPIPGMTRTPGRNIRLIP